MDVNDIERAAHIVYQICREHPEICPHDYEWYMSNGLVSYYKCTLCGMQTLGYAGGLDTREEHDGV